MDTFEKVEILGRSAQYDLCGEACGTDAARKNPNFAQIRGTMLKDWPLS